MATSLLTAGTAHADTADGAKPFTVGLSFPDATHGTVYLERGRVNPDSSVGQYRLREADNLAPKQLFTVEPAKDGRFHLKNQESDQCLLKAPEDEYPDFPQDVADKSTCNDTTNTEWYVQQVGKAGHKFLIRHVDDDLCMAPYPAPTEGKRIDAIARLVTCNAGDFEQRWFISTKPGDDTDTVLGNLSALATRYALKQFDAQSSVITSAKYEPDSTAKATLGPIQNATTGAPAKNGTTSDMDLQVNWSQTTSYTYTAGGSVTTTAGINVGGEKSPVSAEFSVAVQGNWSNSWRTDQTQGGSTTIHIRPGTYGWIARGQLTKAVTGKWTITNDLGDTWIGYGTAVIPAKDGTDGQNSITIGCTSDGQDPSCRATDPGRPAD
ncbi:hypothetical protein [Streptomyces tubercidicus]|uniref:hypothetical protein n=1 Tax=Streptomyces tubercidicus TaxID=47759 RepID=UPI0036807203